MITASTRRLVAMLVVAVLLAFAPVYHAICVTMSTASGSMSHAMADGSTMGMASSTPDPVESPVALIAAGAADPLALLGTVLIVAGVAIAIGLSLRFCADRARLQWTASVGPRPHPQPPDRHRRRARAPVDLITLSISRT